MSASAGQWPAVAGLVASGCGDWTVASPGSNLSSLPCSPYRHPGYGQAESFALDNVAGYQQDCVPAKRARLMSPAQAYGQGSTLLGLAVSCETPFLKRASSISIFQQPIDRLSSTSDRVAACGEVAPSRFAAVPEGSSTLVAASLYVAPSCPSVGGAFLVGTAAHPGLPTLQAPACCQGPSQAYSAPLQRTLSDGFAYGTLGWGAPGGYVGAVRAPHASQAPLQPPAVQALHAAPATCAGVAGGLTLPFVFTGRAGTAAPAQPSLQPAAGHIWAGAAACAAAAPGVLACNPHAAPGQYFGPYAQGLGLGAWQAQACCPAGIAAQLQQWQQLAAAVAQPQLQAQPQQQLQPLLQLGAAAPLLDALSAACCAPCQPALAPLTLSLQHQHQRTQLLLLQQPQQQQQPAQPQPPALPLPQPQPASQLVRRVRSLSPAPHRPCSPPRCPASLGPEEWVLHVAGCLGLSGADTPRLALHCWRRVAELPQLHHASRLWASVAEGKNLYATACLWVSIKLEEKRRAAPGGVVLAHMAGASPGSLCSAEVAVMNWLGWRPYEGYRLDESHLLVYM